MEMKKKDIQEETIELQDRILVYIKKYPKTSAWDMVIATIGDKKKAINPIFGIKVSKPDKQKLYSKILYNLKKLEEKGKIKSEIVDSTAPLPKRIYEVTD